MSWKCFQIHLPHESSIQTVQDDTWSMPILVHLLQAQPTVSVMLSTQSNTPLEFGCLFETFSAPLFAQVCRCPHTGQMRFLSINVPWRIVQLTLIPLTPKTANRHFRVSLLTQLHSHLPAHLWKQIWGFFIQGVMRDLESFITVKTRRKGVQKKKSDRRITTVALKLLIFPAFFLSWKYS